MEHSSPLKLSRASLSVLLLIVCAVFGMALWFWWNGWHNSAVSFLPHRRPAAWIVYPSPFLAHERPRVELDTKFRRELVLQQVPSRVQLSWCGFTRCTVALNDVPL